MLDTIGLVYLGGTGLAGAFFVGYKLGRGAAGVTMREVRAWAKDGREQLEAIHARNLVAVDDQDEDVEDLARRLGRARGRLATIAHRLRDE